VTAGAARLRGVGRFRFAGVRARDAAARDSGRCRARAAPLLRAAPRTLVEAACAARYLPRPHRRHAQAAAS
jgi:hypothetical protein